MRVAGTPRRIASATARAAEAPEVSPAPPTTRQRSHAPTATATASPQKQDVSAKITSAALRSASINCSRNRRTALPARPPPAGPTASIPAPRAWQSPRYRIRRYFLRFRGPSDPSSPLNASTPSTAGMSPHIKSRSSTADRSPTRAAQAASPATTVVLPTPPRPETTATKGARWPPPDIAEFAPARAATSLSSCAVSGGHIRPHRGPCGRTPCKKCRNPRCAQAPTDPHPPHRPARRAEARAPQAEPGHRETEVPRPRCIRNRRLPCMFPTQAADRAGRIRPTRPPPR